jgi:predicted amidohydrolase
MSLVSTPPADLVVAAAQIVESAAGVETVRRMATEAAARGADLLLFPEMSLHGYSIGAEAIRAAATPRTGPLLAAVREIAARSRIALCVGYAELDPATGSIFNAAALVDANGTLVHHYRKCHLYGAYELSVFTAGGGDELAVGVLQPVRAGARPLTVGLMVCMDCEYPEPARVLALQGAQLILIPTALGVGPVARMTPDAVVPTRALENHVHVAYANYNGPAIAAGYEAAYCGRSAIFGPDGVELGRAPGMEAHHRGIAACEALIVGQVHLAAFAADVKRNPYLAARRPELYWRIAGRAADGTDMPRGPGAGGATTGRAGTRTATGTAPLGKLLQLHERAVLVGVGASIGAAVAWILFSHKRRS